MEIPKPSDADRAYFELVVSVLPEAEIKPMFGNLAGFVNGNMFCGLFGSDLGVRLDAEGREELSAISGSGPFGPAERPMKEYVTLPPSWRAEGQDDEVAAWLHRALAHSAQLPPKKKKAKKSAKKGTVKKV